MNNSKTQQQARGFSSSELDRLVGSFVGAYADRDRSMFLLGIATGAKISELLSLSVSDVDRDDVCVHLRSVGVSSIALNNDGYIAIETLLSWHISVFGDLVSDRPLFASRTCDDGGIKAITRQQAHRILKDTCILAGVNGSSISTHSLRVTHSQRLYCVEVLSDPSTNPYIVEVAE